jgi:hypothetical protein
VRGVDQSGQDLVISRDYISRGLRSRAEELAAIELGPKPEHEIRSALEREVGAERWTRLDAEIRMAADETGFIDLRPDHPGSSYPEIRRLMIGRLQHLEKMGLAAPAGPGEWMVGLEAERSLRDLGMRGDIIKTMHRAFAERGIGDYVIKIGTASPIIGRWPRHRLGARRCFTGKTRTAAIQPRRPPVGVGQAQAPRRRRSPPELRSIRNRTIDLAQNARPAAGPSASVR